jgi:hypothetical protein
MTGESAPTIPVTGRHHHERGKAMKLFAALAAIISAFFRYDSLTFEVHLRVEAK